MYFHIAERLHRTVEELLYGSPECEKCGHSHGSFRALSASELVEWAGHYKLTAQEMEIARNEAKNQR